LSVEQLAASKKLLNRARDRRLAFIVMPFRKDLNPVYGILKAALEANGWDVLRADQISHPRRITDAIVQAILASDLVVADITSKNPNVFYELGLAHAAGCDVVMLTQEGRIPFDVGTERAVIYRLSQRGLLKLDAEIKVLTK
jgi:hypothetical protein